MLSVLDSEAELQPLNTESPVSSTTRRLLSVSMGRPGGELKGHA